MKQLDNHYYKDVPEKDVSFIPPGIYCYHPAGERRFVCPFWDYDATKDKQESGYCHFLDQKDWDDGVGLLWDFCKECGENDDSIYDNCIIDKKLTKEYDKLVVEWAKKILPLIANEEHKSQLSEWLSKQD